MAAHQDPHSPSDPPIPAALADSMKRLDRSRALPDLAALDQAVLGAADAHFDRRARAARRIQTLRFAAGIAASIALFAAVAWRTLPGRPSAQTLAADVLNTDHSITILDAFRLAKLLESAGASHAKLSPSWDVNTDGVIDQHDVDALAQRAVKLSSTLGTTGTGGGT